MLARRVVQHHVDQHLYAALVRFGDESLEVVVRAVRARDLVVVRHVVAVIARRFHDRHQPDAPRAEATLAASDFRR